MSAYSTQAVRKNIILQHLQFAFAPAARAVSETNTTGPAPATATTALTTPPPAPPPPAPRQDEHAVRAKQRIVRTSARLRRFTAAPKSQAA